ncbi:hypothetical protein BDR03DRAFT_960416 [Suillus americanus]|nr:hypothetical protein BDR03DRAFT_960416 [Suillus americanus]
MRGANLSSVYILLELVTGVCALVLDDVAVAAIRWVCLCYASLVWWSRCIQSGNPSPRML